MVRSTAILVALTLVGVASACPWWGRCHRPRPIIGCMISPPPVVVAPEAPKASPAPVETPKVTEKFDAAALYEKAVRSCVFIVTPTRGGHTVAAGALIDAEKRLVITTYDAVEENAFTFVQFPVRLKDGSLMTDQQKYIERIPAGQAIKGKVLHRDKTRNLALAQLDKLPPDTPALLLARQSVRVGSTALWIGHGKQGNVTFATTVGVVRAVGVEDFAVPGAAGMRIKARMLTLTNPVPGGVWGGPILDERGNLVGVSVDTPGLQNFSRAIAVTDVREFLAEKKINIAALPSDLRSEPLPRPALPPALPPAGDERAAAILLQRAMLFADNDEDRPYYLTKLREVVTKYPDTAAAKEVKKVLDQTKK